MDQRAFTKTRIYLIVIVTLAIWLLLAWHYYHGGVPSHHILAREDLPEFSNWWGALLLPLLAWFLTYRIQQRLFKKGEPPKSTSRTIYGFAGAVLFGVLLSTFFTLGLSDMAGYLVLTLFIIAFFIPIYRSEYLLGFVIGMTFTFGAVLPMGIGSIFAAISAILYLLIRPAILYFASKIGKLSSSDTSN